MKYQDPAQVACPSCGANQAQPVHGLLALEARCVACDASLEAIGLEMRAQLRGWSAYVGRVETAIEIERALGVTILDSELDAVRTATDLVTLVRTKLPPSDARGSDVAEIVRGAIAATRRSET